MCEPLAKTAVKLAEIAEVINYPGQEHRCINGKWQHPPKYLVDDESAAEHVPKAVQNDEQLQRNEKRQCAENACLEQYAHYCIREEQRKPCEIAPTKCREYDERLDASALGHWKQHVRMHKLHRRLLRYEPE